MTVVTPQRAHHVEGQWVRGEGSERIPVHNPATGDLLTEIPAGGAPDAARAVQAARRAQPAWSARPATERAAVLRELAAAMRAGAEDLAELQTVDNGKPLAMSRGDVAAAAATLDQYAELGPLHRGRSLIGQREALDVMVAEPYGVAAVMVPWNDPLGIAAGLVGAALAVGNTVVLKPSERAPLSLIRMVELMDAPAGVCNLLLGDGRAGAALVEHPDVDLICHVGSVATGRDIAARAGRLLKKVVLELGGKDPLIVDEDVDPLWAAEQAAAGAFANAGQICTSVERIYVHRALAEPFTEALVDRARALVVGDGRDDGVQMGPLVDARQLQTVHRQVRAAVDAGARLLTGGAPLPRPGCFYPPTVLTDVPDDTELMTQETFGPVAPLRVVDSFAEALALADGTSYGLAAGVLTASQARAQEAWRTLRVGTVKINAVWGGAPGGSAHPHKRSGLGYGYGPELLDEVSITKVVHYEPAP